MSQNGQTHFKNPAANTARFLKCVCDHFGTLCIKGLIVKSNQWQTNWKEEKMHFLQESLCYAILGNKTC